MAEEFKIAFSLNDEEKYAVLIPHPEQSCLSSQPNLFIAKLSCIRLVGFWASIICGCTKNDTPFSKDKCLIFLRQCELPEPFLNVPSLFFMPLAG